MEEINDVVRKIVADAIPDPTGGLLTDEDKLQTVVELVDPFVQVAFGDKSLEKGAHDLLNAGCRGVDRTLDRGLDVAEKSTNAVVDGVSSTIDGVGSVFRTIGSLFKGW